MSDTSQKNKSENKDLETPKLPHLIIEALPKLRSLFMRLFLEFGSVVLSLAIMWFAGLGILMNRPSVDMTFVKPHYEHWFSQAFAGKTTDIENYSARWVQERRVIEVLAAGIHIRNADGAEQVIKDMRGEFRIKDNFWAMPEIVRLGITGGALTVIRGSDKRIQVSLGTPSAAQNVGVLWQSDAGTGGKNLLGKIEEISVSAADMYGHDIYNDLQVRFTDLDGIFTFAQDDVSLDAVGVLVAKDGAESAFSVEVRTTQDFQALSGELVINNLVPAIIAPVRGPLADLAKLDAPIDLTAIIDSNEDDGLRDLQVSLIAGSGRLKTGTTYKPFTHARIETHYDVAAKNIQIQALEIESEAVNIVAKGQLQNPKAGFGDFVTKPIDFSIDIASARLNPGIRFDGPITLQPSQIAGTFNWKNHSLELQNLDLDFGTFQTDLSAGFGAQ